MSQPALEARPISASFRDPGSLFRYDGRILRVVNALGAADLEAFLAAPSGKKLMASGTVVPTRRLDDAECSQLLADPAVRELYQSRGKFDAVLMLAVIHRMLVTEGVPLADIIDLAAELTTNILVIELVAPDDTMFQRLTRGREELHKDLTPAVFEAQCARHFEIVRVQHVEGSTRWLYLLRRRP